MPKGEQQNFNEPKEKSNQLTLSKIPSNDSFLKSEQISFFQFLQKTSSHDKNSVILILPEREERGIQFPIQDLFSKTNSANNLKYIAIIEKEVALAQTR